MPLRIRQSVHLLPHDPIEFNNYSCLGSDPRSLDSFYEYQFLGRLTPKGEEELTFVGNWLRQKFIVETPFLSDCLTNVDELYVRSTNYRRTIYSVDHLLLGLCMSVLLTEQCHHYHETILKNWVFP